jgi:phage-related protein/DNA-binding XRE family transcriptional regulator
MNWKVDILNKTVEQEIEALPEDMQAKLLRIIEMIGAMGLERMREPYVKHLEKTLWEMRMTGRDGISRAIYVTASGKRVVIVRAFVKKTQKTPRRSKMSETIPFEKLSAKWRKNPSFMREYEALEEEFALAAALIGARAQAGLTQEELAQRMGTTQSAIARMEGGKAKPSTTTLAKLAKATGTRLRVSFEVVATKPEASAKAVAG